MSCEDTFFVSEAQEFICEHKDKSLSKMCDFVRRPSGPNAHQFVHVVSINPILQYPLFYYTIFRNSFNFFFL